jgi:hypothetical protein
LRLAVSMIVHWLRPLDQPGVAGERIRTEEILEAALGVASPIPRAPVAHRHP